MKRILIPIVLLLLLLSSVPAFAQKTPWGVPNRLVQDNQLFRFGFLVGYNQFNFTIKTKDQPNVDSLMSINTTGLSGFNLGILVNLRLGKYFDLRFVPGLSFGDRIVNYTIRYPNQTNLVTKKNIESVYLDLPLLLKFKSSRMHNFRVYVLAGAQYSMDMISSAKKQEANPREIYLKLNPHDFQGIAGVGFDIYFNYFKFSTELKMSFGFVNLLKYENNMYASNVTSLKSKILQISFLIE